LVDVNYIIFIFIGYSGIFLYENYFFVDINIIHNQINPDISFMDLSNDSTLNSITASIIDILVSPEIYFDANLYIKFFFYLTPDTDLNLYFKFTNTLLDHDTQLIHPLINDIISICLYYQNTLYFNINSITILIGFIFLFLGIN